jgi:hypothetical protein
MGSRKNKTLKKNKKYKGGNNSPDFFGKKTFLNFFQKRYDHENKLEDELKKAHPNVSIVQGKDLKPGCTYKFIDPSIYDQQFTVKYIKKKAEQGPKTASGEEYELTNEGWIFTSYPIGGNDKFILQKCAVQSIKSRMNKSRKNKK